MPGERLAKLHKARALPCSEAACMADHMHGGAPQPGPVSSSRLPTHQQCGWSAAGSRWLSAARRAAQSTAWLQSTRPAGSGRFPLVVAVNREFSATPFSWRAPKLLFLRLQQVKLCTQLHFTCTTPAWLVSMEERGVLSVRASVGVPCNCAVPPPPPPPPPTLPGCIGGEANLPRDRRVSFAPALDSPRQLGACVYERKR